jgi:hypothetical protein
VKELDVPNQCVFKGDKDLHKKAQEKIILKYKRMTDCPIDNRLTRDTIQDMNRVVRTNIRKITWVLHLTPSLFTGFAYANPAPTLPSVGTMAQVKTSLGG